MLIRVDKVPKVCCGCEYIGELGDRFYHASGCTLLRIKLPIDIRMTTRLGNCPLRKKKVMK